MSEFFALDLELEQPSNEIIQIGVATKGGRRNFYITPSQPVSEFIQGLTGITDSDFCWSKSRRECLVEFVDWVNNNSHTCREAITWGTGDIPALYKELKTHGLSVKNMSTRRFIDCKTLFLTYQFIRTGRWHSKASLKTAVSMMKLALDGSSHDAADDAYNTLQVFNEVVDRFRLPITSAIAILEK